MQRSPRTQENQDLTSLGRRLLVQADEHLGANLEAPPPLPEPLASALACFWGPQRLRWFATAARSGSLAAAATAVWSDRYSVDRSIRALEEAVGGVLLRRSSPSRAHRLTPLARRLLAQAESDPGTLIGLDTGTSAIVEEVS